jgi:integrase
MSTVFLNYQIKSFIMKSGERYCLLADKSVGIPLYLPNLYITTQVRNSSKSVAAMESALTGLNVLLTFCDGQGVNLELRLLKREFFEPHELDAFRDFCQQKFVSRRVDQSKKLVTPIRKSGRKRPSQKASLPSEYMRLTYAAKYIDWLSQHLLSAEKYRESKSAIERMIQGLNTRRPNHKGRNITKREKGLSKEQVALLMEIIRPDSELNPFNDPSVQTRNRVLILLLLHLGIRRGELLNIRVRDIDWSRNQIVIARRADEKDDPRIRQPLVKTLDRRAPMKDTLVEAIHKYIKIYRNKFPNARKHDYLFVTHKSGPTQGLPMSIQAYDKVIRAIAKAAPSLSGLRGHEIRHTWNNNFSELIDEMDIRPSSEEQEAIRSNLQGWKPESGSAAVYTKRYIREKAMEAGLALQESTSRIPENLKNG